MQKLLPQILQLKILRPQTAFSLSAANLVWGLKQHAYSVHFGHRNTLSPKIPIQILPTDLHIFSLGKLREDLITVLPLPIILSSHYLFLP